jgi:hypothetical protein
MKFRKSAIFMVLISLSSFSIDNSALAHGSSGSAGGSSSSGSGSAGSSSGSGSHGGPGDTGRNQASIVDQAVDDSIKHSWPTHSQ